MCSLVMHRSWCWRDTHHFSLFPVSEVRVGSILLHAARNSYVWWLSRLPVRNLTVLLVFCFNLIRKDVIHNPDDGLHYGLYLLQR